MTSDERPKRKPLSKRTRFEVFKRDDFQCAYCGRRPPEIVLHVDHIVPVAEGGGDDFANLLTACDECNLGKGPVALGEVEPPIASDAPELMVERAEQMRAYREAMEDWLAERREFETFVSTEIYGALWGHIESDRMLAGSFAKSAQHFVSVLGFQAVLDLASMTGSKSDSFRDFPHAFRYFAGCCWKRVKGEDWS